MITNRNPRSYEVSIWTLQDSFITVLKPANLEYKGQIENPEIEISDENENTLTFRIPMHIIKDNKQIENPIWYNTQNGVIIENMRKLKVIFNKDKSNKRIFEFLIVKVTEQHEGFETYCEIESEELAFHELGKTGYKIDLSTDLYNIEYNEWLDNKRQGEEPINNIDYWTKKVLDGTLWDYKKNFLYDDGTTGDIVYEDAYVSHWEIANDKLVPAENSVVPRREKLRLIDENNSNRYNLIQTIAEAFGVFCSFEYEYDDNYNIIGRHIIYYNNYIKDNDDNIIDLNYHYDTEDITREKDATELTTKMFVLSNDDGSLLDNTITGVEANQLLEDYLLNFDYLYKIGTITQEQYDEIDNYKVRIHELNIKIKELSDKIIYCEDILLHARASLESAKQSLVLDQEAKQEEEAYIKHLLDNSNNYIEGEEPEYISISKELIYLYVNNEGKRTFSPRHDKAIASSLTVYSDSNEENLLTDFTIVYDESNIFIDSVIINTDLSMVYINYEFSPELYHKIVREQWIKKLANDANVISEYQPIVDKLYGERDANDELKDPTKPGLIQEYKDKQEILLAEKQQIISDFENMMGPALREGTWQPEDDYAKYSEKHQVELSFNNKLKAEDTELLWDKDLFEEEDTNYVKEGINEELRYYPAINASQFLDIVKDGIENPVVVEESEEIEGNKTIKTSSIKTFGFVFKETKQYTVNTYENEEIVTSTVPKTEIKITPVKYGFVEKEDTVYPVIFLTGIYEYYNSNIIEEEINKYISDLNGYIGYMINKTITTIINDEIANVDTVVEQDIGEKTIQIQNSSLIENLNTYTTVYPRIKITSTNFKNSSDEFYLTYNNVPLQEYNDFYILSKYNGNDINWSIIGTDEDTSTSNDYCYYLTIRPEFLLKQNNYNGDFIFNYALSNTGLMIYLDAVKILKENSMPKVSYTVTPKLVKNNILEHLYDCIHNLVHINDYELKFENVTGYISNLKLKLDKPWEDEIEVKNYKNKFEDLFSSIVASTAQIEKSSYALNAAMTSFTSTGELNNAIIQKSIDENNLSYYFNDNNLTITEKDGMMGISDEGAVVFNKSGIFTATEKDEEGNWKWNTGILPRGISANIITAGQLDTNLIRIYAGDDLRFQFNGDGLFAYKSWLEDYDRLSDNDEKQGLIYKFKKYNDRDPGQYVVYNSDGLFLIAEKGSKPIYETILKTEVNLKDGSTINWPVLKDPNDISKGFQTKSEILDEELSTQVKRVEISWDGLKLSNWKGENTFYADPDTGDLIIAGTLLQNASFVTIPTETLQNIKENYIEESNSSQRILKKTLLRSGEQEFSIKSFEDYVVDELIEDNERDDKHVKFLTPSVAAVKIDDFIKFRATNIADQIVQDALDSNGRISTRINEVSNIITDFIDNDYRPILNNISMIHEESTLPLNPEKFYTVKLTEDNGIYEAEKIYWWDGIQWNELENTNINLGTSSSLNLFGANATFAAGSELKMLAGGKLHLFGGEVYISSNNIIERDNSGKITTPVTNGIVLDGQGLAIYSTNNIIIGSHNNGELTAGMEINGSNGSFTIITNNSEESDYNEAGIKLYHINNGNKVEALTINGNGININSNGYLNVQSKNFVINSKDMDANTIFKISYPTDDMGGELNYNELISIEKYEMDETPSEIDSGDEDQKKITVYPAYQLKLGSNITFSDDFYNILYNNIPSSIVSTTRLIEKTNESQETERVPDFPDNAPNGTLGILYTEEIIKNQSITGGTLDVTSSPILSVTNEYSDPSHTGKYFGIELKRWNLQDNTRGINPPTYDYYVRVGTALTASNTCGAIAKLVRESNSSTTINAGEELTLTFEFRDRFEKNTPTNNQFVWDVFGFTSSATNKRYGTIIVDLIAATKYTDFNHNITGTVIATGTFIHPDDGKVLNNESYNSTTPEPGQVSLTLKESINTSLNDYYIILYSKVTHSLFYLDVSSIKISGSGQSQQTDRYGLYIKSNNEWHPWPPTT